MQFEVLTLNGTACALRRRGSHGSAEMRCSVPFRNAEAGLLTGLLVGGSKNLSDTDQTAFRIAGLSHLVAVSGLHIGFLVGFARCCSANGGERLCPSRWCCCLCRSGATPSVLRAALMYLTAAGGFLLRRRSGGLNALLMALAVLLLVNPYAIASVGLQLFHSRPRSVLSCSQGSCSMHSKSRLPVRRNSCARRLRSSRAHSSCTVCATIFTVPILLTSFGAVSVLSPISNLMTVGVTSLCFVGGFVLCVAAAVCPALVLMLAGLVRPLISYLLWSANIIADPASARCTRNNTFGLAALGIVLAALLVWLTVGSMSNGKAVLPCLAVVLGSAYVLPKCAAP